MKFERLYNRLCMELFFEKVNDELDSWCREPKTEINYFTRSIIYELRYYYTETFHGFWKVCGTLQSCVLFYARMPPMYGRVRVGRRYRRDFELKRIIRMEKWRKNARRTTWPCRRGIETFCRINNVSRTCHGEDD